MTLGERQIESDHSTTAVPARSKMYTTSEYFTRAGGDGLNRTTRDHGGRCGMGTPKILVGWATVQLVSPLYLMFLACEIIISTDGL